MKIISNFFLAILAFAASTTATFQTQPEDEGFDISPKCAAVLLSGGTLAGAGLAYAVTPAALCTAGFCPAGVSGASFASWWQSTMPVVSAGSAFTVLQSAAMGRVGAKTMLTGSMLGGALSMTYLKELCAYVDDPDSEMATVFDAILAAVRAANAVTVKAKATCSSSESCTATIDLAKIASRTVSSSVSSMWSYVSDGMGQAADAWAKSVIQFHKKEIERLEEELEDLRKKMGTEDVAESVFVVEKELNRHRERLIKLNQK